jgi:hypothetical protein
MISHLISFYDRNLAPRYYISANGAQIRTSELFAPGQTFSNTKTEIPNEVAAPNDQLQSMLARSCLLMPRRSKQRKKKANK